MRRRWTMGLALALLLICFGQMAAAAPRLSLTADEPVYIAAGYAYLRTGNLRLQPSVQHPPLMNVWEAWPLLLRSDTPDVNIVAGWDKAELSRFIIALLPQLGPIQATAFAARVPVMWLALLLAAVVYRWATDWGGRIAGLAALGLFAFDPNLLAHGSLATTDLGVTAFTFIALYGLMRFLRRPTWGAFLLAGIGLGLAMAAKTSGILLVAAFALITILSNIRRPLRSAAYLAGLMALACTVIWAVMGFELRAPAGWPVPLPAATYWLQVADFGRKSAGGQTAFLMGRLSQHGWWYYYPVAFALKTPLPTMILLVISLVWGIGSGKWVALGVFPILYGAGALLSSFNTGYRFLLPVLPFLFVFIAIHISNLKFKISDISRYVCSRFRLPVLRFTFYTLLSTLYLLLFTWYASSTLRTFPHYLAYFNEAIGGPDQGYKWLVDSNLDWGQGWVELGQYAKTHNIAHTNINVSQYTLVDAALYDVNAIPIAPSRQAPPVFPARFDPAPGIYAIGATTLQGVMMADPYNYDWFRHRQPAAKLGHALFIYDVPTHTHTPTWVAQCTQPAAPLTPEVIAEGFGRADLRLAYFDCTTSWLLPVGGQSPGWYVLHRDVALAGDRFIKHQLDETSLSYEQRTNQASPAFAMYERLAGPQSGCAKSASLEGPLDFLGYIASQQLARPGSTIEVETCWQVTAQTDRPLSLMLHMVSPNGATLVADGLGVPIEQWQVGDIIVQRHQLQIPPDAQAGEYQVQAGAYWLDTLDRWPTRSGDQPGADTVALPPITVEAGR